MATNKVFVSPGVYTSEKDLSYVTRQVGVTTLGLVGETTQGPAFQPIFISNYDEFKSFFGGLDATRVKDNGMPLYELPFIAKEFLTTSNQLFVTRVLGFSGYDAGYAWGITMDAALDGSTSGTTGGGASYATLFSFTANSANTITSVVSSDPLIQSLWNDGLLSDEFAFLATTTTGSTAAMPVIFKKSGNTFTGTGISNWFVTGVGTSGSNTTGTTSGVTAYYSGTGYSEVENTLVALLRPRGAYDGNEKLSFEVTGGTTPIGFSSAVTAAESDPNGSFRLSGTSLVSGAFNYDLSFDNASKNYLPLVLGRTASDAKTAVFVEELYDALLDNYITDGKVRGINLSLVNYSTKFKKYKQSYSPAVTPWIVSELRGSNLFRLFRLWTISDGNAANKQFKISVQNIKPNDRTFDLIVRNYNDTDTSPVVLEQWVKLSMDPTSDNYVAKRIGTLDGEYVSKSVYILVELGDDNTDDAFPAGFIGYPVRDYTENGNSTVKTPKMTYKTTYTTNEKTRTNIRKSYLGLSTSKGVDQDFFDYKGIPDSTTIDIWTGMTKGFHMDVDATGATIDNVKIVINNTGGTYSPVFLFETGDSEFRTEAGTIGTSYALLASRKFSLVPSGGYDAWDIYRTRRTNTESYSVNGTKGTLGLTNGNFSNLALTNGDTAINSDYYAYLEGIWTFKNPEAININVFATPGINTFDNANLIDEAIEMVEQDRADSLYVVTTPDSEDDGITPISPDTVVSYLDNTFDSSYTCTYWPWVQVTDTEIGGQYIFIPPTRDVVRNIAYTDNKTFPWFAVAGIDRGSVATNTIKARITLTQSQRDTLYEGRINPVATFASDGVKIWGNKTLQIKDSALNRINVRRLLLQARKLISAVSIRLLFEQNDTVVRNQFLALVNPILDSIRAERGLTDFRVVLDDTPESIDRGELIGRIYLKPTKSLEFISIEFTVMNTGASFDNV
jgi:hypothetical protein